MVYGGDAAAGYTVVLEGTGEGTFDLTVGSPNRSSNTSDTVDFVDVPVTSATRVELALAPSTDYALQIDNEGDGLLDEQRLPDSVTRYDIDLTPPSNVTDLVVTDVSSGTATLSFTAPGDDAGAGTAQYYDIRYATVPITKENWKEAEPVETIPLPQPAGSTETLTVTGLEAGTTYYFALKAKDEVLQTSALSNVAQATTTKPSLTWARQRVYWASWADYSNRHLSIEYRMSNVGTGTAINPTVQASLCTPASVYIVTQLPLGVVSNLSPGARTSVTLKYFVPTTVYSFTTATYANCKDDAGRLYYSTAAITDQYWQDAVPVSNLPAPLLAGSSQTITVSGLSPGTTYYFALKAMDESALFSPLSNVASGTTTIPRLSWSKQRIYWANWTDYQNRQLSIDYRMSNTGTGVAMVSTVQASFCNPGTVYTVTQLPSVVGDINPGSNRTVTLKYFVPTTVGSFTTTTYATCQDDIGSTYWSPGPMP